MREFINGAEAIARGAMRAGCDFFSGYPITPATPILLHMIRELPKVGGVAIQSEDEIAAIGFCIGAALSGSRVMTATSGPGMSLFSENIGAGIMAEVPMVIVDVQRMGPATGGATTGSQSDVQFLRWGTPGGFPIIALSPTNVSDCYLFIQRAFDLAERYRLPVFLACDKQIVLNRTTIVSSKFEEINVRQRTIASAKEDFVPYRFIDPEEVPPMSHYGGPHLVRITTSSHDEHGYLTKKNEDMEYINRHLSAKIFANRKEISDVRFDSQDGADTLIISYGITAQSVREAVQTLRQFGSKISSLIVLSLWPVPEQQIRKAIKGVKRIIVVELNQGQYRREVERLANDSQEVIGVNREDGRLISPVEILERGELT